MSEEPDSFCPYCGFGYSNKELKLVDAHGEYFIRFMKECDKCNQYFPVVLYFSEPCYLHERVHCLSCHKYVQITKGHCSECGAVLSRFSGKGFRFSDKKE